MPATNFAKPINNIATTVAVAYTAGSGSLTVASASGITLSASQWIRLSTFRSGSPLSILKASAVTGNVLTIDGGVDGYTDVNLLVGDAVELRVTAGAFADIHAAVNTLETTSGPVTSVFGRTGVVVATTGDYTVAQVTGAAPLASPTFTGTVTEPVPVWPSQSQHAVFAAPSGSAGAPSFRAIVSSDLPTIPIGSGGTGQTTAFLAFNALSPMSSLGDMIYGGASGTGTRLGGNNSTTKNFLTQTGTGSLSAAPAWGTIAVADVSGAATDSLVVHLAGTESITGSKTFSSVPTLPNQSANVVFAGPTTGAAATPTFRSMVVADLPTVDIAHGGTGQTTQTAGFNALSPLTTLGDLLYRNGSNNVRLAGNTTSTKNFLTQTGTGSVSAAPAWGTIAVADVSGAATDSLVVHLAGTESITGAKTFSSVPTLPNQSANLVFAGPTTGAAAAPTFRSQVVADLPTVDIAHGGTGQTTKAPAFDALSPMTTAGDLIYGGASGTGTRFAPNTTATKNFLTMTSSTPAWGTIGVADVSGAATDSLVVHLAGTESITGAKTFSLSPTIPTPSDGDSTTKAASTAYALRAVLMFDPALITLCGAL